MRQIISQSTWCRNLAAFLPKAFYVAIVLFVACLTGCGARSKCPACQASAAPTMVQKACALSATTMESSMLRAFATPSATSNILLLSGGGSHGAWGAGVLHGWKNTPSFQIVTGISTGALMATFAFLGEAYDELLKRFYTTISEEDIIRRRSLLGVLFSNSFYSTKPLKRLLKQQLTNALIDDVARAATAEGRQLWVGTVDLDTGQFCSWDLTQIAQQKDYDLYRDVVLASASMPVLTPPVDIDGSLHVDGGTRLQVFAAEMLERALRSYELMLRSKERSPDAPPPEKPTTYIVINGKLVVEKDCTKNAVIDIGLRSLTLVLNETLLGNLHRLQGQYGNDWRFQASWIPDDYCLNFGTFDFDRDTMQRLFVTGSNWVQNNAWHTTIVPRLDISPLPCGCAAPTTP